MLSTLTSYRVYSNDISKSLARIQASSTVKRDETYYEDNIGKVTTVDEFLDDQRLYTYALKAYGLADQASSKGFIKKVVESDLSDSNSFANKLSDTRYREFAAAFNFKTGATKPTAQSTGQQEGMIEAYSERSVRNSTVAAQKTNYFSDQMSKITSLDQLLSDPTLYDVAVRSVGIDPDIVTKDYVVGMFKQFASLPTQTGLIPLATLASKFNFQADGTVPAGQRALSEDDTDLVNNGYFKNTGNTTGPAYAAHLSAYYEKRIGSVDGAEDIAGDERMFQYVTTAFGLDSSIETPEYIYSILASDPNDPSSTLGSMPTSTPTEAGRKALMSEMNKAFNFKDDGKLDAGKPAQTAEQTETTKNGYYANYKTLTDKKDASAVLTFKMTIEKTKSVSDLMTFDSAFGRDALNVALKAFDIDPATADLTKVRLALESDASDPNSYVSKLQDERYTKLSAAFNFDSDGKLRTERLVQSPSAQTATGTLYAATYKNPTVEQKALIKTETADYLESLGDIDTLDQLLKSDKTLDYALRAYGLDKEKLDETKLRKIFTSDLGDPKSYVYTLKDKRYEDLAKAFNFLPSGAVRTEATGVQSDANRLSTENLYRLQTLEEQAGDQSEGTRLALYFLRKAPDVKSTLSILADKALLEVAKTALGLPDSLSQLDIDTQVKAIEKKLKVEDFQDKGKLDRFIARFSVLYDLKNNSGADSPIMALFGDSDSDSTTSLLASL